MSSHFNYEIDEINLRSKLREMNYPFKEEAWHSFESFSDACKTQIKSRNLPQFNLSINRNILVPVFFGAGILLLSLLLYKLISNNISVDEKQPLSELNEAPKTEEKITPQTVDTTLSKPTISENIKSDSSAVNTSSTPVITNSISATNTVAVVTNSPEPVKTNTQAAVVPTPAIGAGIKWLCYNNTDVFIEPNLVSKKIGKVNNGQWFSALEETNYYIKAVYDQSGNTGYILKVFLRKNGQVPPTTPRRKENKAEEMETKTVTNLLPSSSSEEEKEPELK